MAENSSGIAEKFSIIRRHLDKILIAASGITMLIGGYFTLEYKNYVDCQARINDSVIPALEANQKTMSVFREALTVLLTQPPRPPEERRRAFEQLQAALDRQEYIMTTIPPVPSEGCH